MASLIAGLKKLFKAKPASAENLKGSFQMVDTPSRMEFVNLDDFCGYINDYNNFISEEVENLINELKKTSLGEQHVESMIKTNPSVAENIAAFLDDYKLELVEALSLEKSDVNLRNKLETALNIMKYQENPVQIQNTDNIVLFAETKNFLKNRNIEVFENSTNLKSIAKHLNNWNENSASLKKIFETISKTKKQIEDIQKDNTELDEEIAICTNAINKANRLDMFDKNKYWIIPELKDKGIDYINSQTNYIDSLSAASKNLSLIETIVNEDKTETYSFDKNGFDEISAHDIFKVLANNDNFILLDIKSPETIEKAEDFDSLHQASLLLTKTQATILAKQFDNFTTMNAAEKKNCYDEYLTKCNTADPDLTSSEKQAQDKFLADHYLTKHVVNNKNVVKEIFEIRAYSKAKKLLEKIKSENDNEIANANESLENSTAEYNSTTNTMTYIQTKVKTLSEKSLICEHENYYGINDSYTNLYNEVVKNIVEYQFPEKIEELNVNQLPSADKVSLIQEFLDGEYKINVVDVLIALTSAVERNDAENIKELTIKLSENVSADSENNISNKIQKHSEQFYGLIESYNNLFNNHSEAE